MTKLSIKINIEIVVLTDIFLGSLAHISFFNNWSNFIYSLQNGVIRTLLLLTTTRFCVLLSGTVCISIFSIFLYNIVKIQKNKNIFRKLKLQGNEIEIFQENNESYFDKYLNEVLYIFENANADVIVFEDMDRYNVNQIFIRLREVNILINNQRLKEKETLLETVIKNIKSFNKSTTGESNSNFQKIINIFKPKLKEPLRFFYLIRDDIFLSKDRTKFFDFIIPIVPVIDASNSYDKFIEQFKHDTIFKNYDENFLQKVFLYVDDMRILKNMYNEFIMYKKRITDTDLNINKLIAIILYKNIFPRDFSELQLGRGFVCSLFEKKSEFIHTEIERIASEIEEIKSQIQALNTEHLTSIDELDTIYLDLAIDFRHIRINNHQEDSYKTRIEFVHEIKANPEKAEYYGLNRNIKRIFDELLSNDEYVARKKVIDSKQENLIPKLDKELTILEKQKLDIENYHLKEIIKRENINTIFSIKSVNEIGEENNFNEIKTSPYFNLIKYLIHNGFIDETYHDYMTYFYENSISSEDKAFIYIVG